jgi:hypothetical protein
LRNLIAVPVWAGGLIAALVTPAGIASAFCDAADCVPNLTRNVIEGTPCVPQPLYDHRREQRPPTPTSDQSKRKPPRLASGRLSPTS